MAEFVQKRMEEMLSEITSIKKTQLLSRPEISKLIEKRRAFEYKLAKLKKNKSDYIEYAHYDIVLLDVIEMRRERFKISTYKEEIEFSIIKRINNHLKDLTFNFPNDLNCWNMMLNFCKSQKALRKSVSRIYEDQLKLLGKYESIWVEWAKWEMIGNANFTEARKIIFEKASLHHPNSLYISKEHFRLELLYVEHCIKESEDSVFEALNEIALETRKDVLKGALAVAIYNDAIKMFDAAQVNREFYLVAEKFDFVKDLQDKISKDMVEMYPKDADTWKIQARRALQNLKNKDDVAQVLEHFDKGLVEVGQSFITAYITESLNLLFIYWQCPTAREVIIDKLISVLSLNKGQLDASFPWLLWINLLEIKECSNAELIPILNEAVKIVPKCSLIRHAILKHKLAEINSDEVKMKTFLSEIKHIDGDSACSAWKLIMSLIKSKDIRLLLLKKITTDLNRDAAKAVWLQELNNIPATCIKRCRKFYKEYNWLPPFSAQLHICMIKKELQRKNISVSGVQSIFQTAVRQFGKFHPGLWVSYISFEHKYGNLCKCTELKAEAENTLNVNQLSEYKRLRLLLTPFFNQEPGETFFEEKIVATPLTGWKPSIFIDGIHGHKELYGESSDENCISFFNNLIEIERHLFSTKAEIDNDIEWREVICMIFRSKISFRSVDSSISKYFIGEEARKGVSELAKSVVKDAQKFEYSTELETQTEYGPIVDTELEEVLKKSDTLKPDFGRTERLPAYHVSKFAKKNMKKHKVPTTAGKGWFDMKAPERTDEVERDLAVFKMRSALLPDHHYKQGLQNNPKFFQMGKVVDTAYDFYDRIPKKQRKQTFAEEIMSNEEVISYQKRKYKEIIAKEKTIKRHKRKKTQK